MEDQKLRQVALHDKEFYRWEQPRIADNSHPYIAWLNNHRLLKAAKMMGMSLAGKTLLSICGGDGEEGDFFQRRGAEVTVTDLSIKALSAAQVRNPALRCVCMDGEELEFADSSFDWAIVRDGLHHLARPIKGLYELDRVSREGFAIIEAQDSLAVRLLSRLGVAENWDPAGGYVYRFSRREIYKFFSSMQTVSRWDVYSAWLPFGSDILGLFPAFRRLAYPIMQQSLVSKLLAAKSARVMFKTLFYAANSVAGRWGNSLIVVAHKR
jgi:ubiquinone/menaquinone biosynthesis C-methylase UbiE